MAGRPIDAERRAKIAKLLAEKRPVVDIMRELGCSRYTIRVVCRRDGFEYVIQRGKLSAEKRDEIIRRLKANDKFAVIAKAAHVGRKTVRQICYSEGIRPEPVNTGRQVIEEDPYKETKYVDYKNIGMHRCCNRHATCFSPCPICLALKANAECTPEVRRSF
jgi:DNA invertase Pin-like site-specific DNA recombinase